MARTSADTLQTVLTQVRSLLDDPQPDVFDDPTLIPLINLAYARVQQMFAEEGIETLMGSTDYYTKANIRSIGMGKVYDVVSATSTGFVGANEPDGNPDDPNSILAGNVMSYLLAGPHDFQGSVPLIAGVLAGGSACQIVSDASNNVTITIPLVNFLQLSPTPDPQSRSYDGVLRRQYRVGDTVRVVGITNSAPPSNFLAANGLAWTVTGVSVVGGNLHVTYVVPGIGAQTSTTISGASAAIILTQYAIITGVIGNQAANGRYLVGDVDAVGTWTSGPALAPSVGFHVNSLSANGVSVPSGLVVADPSLPGDFMMPLYVWEKGQTDPDSNYQLMRQAQFIDPAVTPGTRHGNWAWMGDVLFIYPATVATILRIVHWRWAPTLVNNTDPILVPRAANAMAYFAAASAARSKGSDKADSLEAQGNESISQIINLRMHAHQSAGRPRRPYGAPNA